MRELTAVFESWHIGDGNYPPFHIGMLVNLSFQLEPKLISPAKFTHQLIFNHLGNAEYDFCGEVIRIFSEEKQKEIFGLKFSFMKSTRPFLIIIDSSGFRFYIENPKIKRIQEGMRIKGKGTLLLDYYMWSETLHKRTNPPHIFYTLVVSRIRKIQIPERFISRQGEIKAYPTRVSPDKFGDVTDLETMEGQRFDEEFYLVDFKETDRVDIPKTFSSLE